MAGIDDVLERLLTDMELCSPPGAGSGRALAGYELTR